MGVETILVERVFRRRKVPPVREYLVWWKGLPRQKANYELEDALGKFMDWNRRFETKVMGSFSRPHYHRGRIPPWAQVSPSMPYIR